MVRLKKEKLPKNAESNTASPVAKDEATNLVTNTSKKRYCIINNISEVDDEIEALLDYSDNGGRFLSISEFKSKFGR